MVQVDFLSDGYEKFNCCTVTKHRDNPFINEKCLNCNRLFFFVVVCFRKLIHYFAFVIVAY